MQINIYPTGPYGVNTYLVYDDAVKKGFIVDPGGSDSNLDKFLAENNIKIEYIILTHGHGDHIGGVSHYKTLFSGAKLIACKGEEEFLKDEKLNESFAMYGFPIKLTADIYVQDSDTINFCDYEIKFIHTPGHTPGGMCILIGDILFSGDTLFSQSIGRTDLPGGDYNLLVDSIKNKLFKLDDNIKVLPGHMGMTSIGHEKEFNPFV